MKLVYVSLSASSRGPIWFCTALATLVAFCEAEPSPWMTVLRSVTVCESWDCSGLVDVCTLLGRACAEAF